MEIKKEIRPEIEKVKVKKPKNKKDNSRAICLTINLLFFSGLYGFKFLDSLPFTIAFFICFAMLSDCVVQSDGDIDFSIWWRW